LIKFEDIAVIDDKGDSEFKFPHIFVDFRERTGPLFGVYQYLRINEHRHESLDELKRIAHFPSKFDAPRFGTVHSKKLTVSDRAKNIFSAGNRSLNVLYDVEGKLDFLAVADVIAIEGTEGAPGRGSSEPMLVQITHRRVTTGKDFWDALIDDPSLKHRMEDQVGREVNEDDQLRIVEFKVTHSWALEQAGADPTPAGVDRRLGRPGRR
jgi:hypothetical protein